MGRHKSDEIHFYIESESDDIESRLVFIDKDNNFYIKEKKSDNNIMYKCNGFIHGRFDERLVKEIKYCIEKKPAKVLMGRWYPNVDPYTVLGFGPLYIIPTIQCKGKRISISFVLNKNIETDDGVVEESTTYIITGYKKVEKFLNFLERKSN